MKTYFKEKIISRLPESGRRELYSLYHFLWAGAAALIYGNPSKHLIVIGVTGTKGKTTTVELIHRILEESGARVASASSLRFRIGSAEEKNIKKMTMPGHLFLQKFLHRARTSGCKYAVIEVTSEGIAQHRHRFIAFDTALVTNVAPEHIESHGGFERYLRAKLDLFWRLDAHGIALLNRDDPHAERFGAATRARKMWYGKEGLLIHGKTIQVRAIECGVNGVSLELGGNEMLSPLQGAFNLNNILAAASVGLIYHVSPEKIAGALLSVENIPGRMERLQETPFEVFVDYAHTPESLRLVYEALGKDASGGARKLICVLGATGGGRDKWKRPEFGKIAAECCDEAIVTNEDPYDEDPSVITAGIAKGFSLVAARRMKKSKIILDRREAIRTALQAATKNSCVVITGKGAEPWIMGASGEKIPWDDRAVVREELEKLKREKEEK